MWDGDFLADDVGGPECIGLFGLSDSILRNACVGPGNSSVTISDGPVALQRISNMIFADVGEVKLTFQAGVP